MPTPNTIQVGQFATSPAMQLDPNYNLQLLDAQRKQAIAQALTQQGLGNIEYDPKGRISPLQGLNKMLAAYLGGNMANDANKNQAELMSQGAQNYARLLGQTVGAGSGGDPMQQSGSAPGPSGSASPVPAGMPQSNGGAVDPFSSVRRQAMAAYMMGNPDLANKLIESVSAPTDQMKNLRDPMGGALTANNLATQNMTPLQKLIAAQQVASPGSAQAQALQGGINKENYIAPVEVKERNLAIDPITHGPIAYNPGVSNGVTPQFTTQNGVTTATGANQLPGYAGANAAIAGAEQGAKEGNSIKSVTGPGGAQITDWGRNIAGSGGAGPGSFASGSESGASAAFPQSGQRRSGTVGPTKTEQAMLEAGGKEFAALPDTINQARTSITGLESALRQLESVKSTGPGTAKTAEVTSILENAFGKGSNGVDSYQLAHKYLSNAMNTAAAGSGANGSDARLESFSAGQPSTDTMNISPLKSSIRYVLGQLDAAKAGGQYRLDQYKQLNANGDQNAAQSSKENWSKVYNPEYFDFNRMSADSQKQFLQSKTDPASWVKGYNQYANDHPGWVK